MKLEFWLLESHKAHPPLVRGRNANRRGNGSLFYPVGRFSGVSLCPLQPSCNLSGSGSEVAGPLSGHAVKDKQGPGDGLVEGDVGQTMRE